MKCIVDQFDKRGRRFDSADDAPDTSYYQWVVFVFAFQAAIFYLPFKLWTVLESNLVASFGTDGKSPVMLSEDAKYDDGVVQEAVIEKLKVLQSDLPPQLLVLRQLRDVRAPQLHPALRPVPDDRQLPQQEVQMVRRRLLSITTSTLRRRGGVLNWD